MSAWLLQTYYISLQIFLFDEGRQLSHVELETTQEAKLDPWTLNITPLILIVKDLGVETFFLHLVSHSKQRGCPTIYCVMLFHQIIHVAFIKQVLC